MTTTTEPISPESTAADLLSTDTVDAYRREGFVRIPQVLTPDEVAEYRDAAAWVAEHGPRNNPGDQMFNQVVNVWRSDDTLRKLTFHPKLARLATELSGVPLRLWHDHLLAKKPHNQTPTEFHQDAPYWPHANVRQCLSAWVALVDVPVERGCMTFIPGQHERFDIRPIDIASPTDLFEAAPDLVYTRRVTEPLRAGDATFHNGFTPHTANANATDDWRYAFVNIYVDREVRYDGRPHVCTDGLGLSVGDPLPEDLFPAF